VESSDVVADQLEYVAKDAVHQFGGYRGNLLLLAAAINQSRVNSLRIENTAANETRRNHHSRNPRRRCFLCLVTLAFDFLTPN